ncbi:hypothetical protein EXIGLDRAFT_836229 [Exidia glandulosa HHB12029]|uniref:Helicase C-terminal domain-containing protein n=1 Tax=Exidia glandulosa HHB12029 TaxID=1314781 RepID=A0A166AK70_EXIGL|nr:hypothetical protein EXIGLDRAFT_836229 [Exidia glandulosa HHB12029]
MSFAPLSLFPPPSPNLTSAAASRWPLRLMNDDDNGKTHKRRPSAPPVTSPASTRAPKRSAPSDSAATPIITSNNAMNYTIENNASSTAQVSSSIVASPPTGSLVHRAARPPRVPRTPEQIMALAVKNGDMLSIPQLDRNLVPSGLKMTLLPHQFQGLAWMKYMENPKYPSTQRDGVVQLWRRKMGRNSQEQLFDDLYARFSTPTEALGKGCIVADDLGLGKTLLLLAHILVSKHTEPVDANSPYCRATLIIVPPSLLQMWARKIEEHIQPGRLQFLVYDGGAVFRNVTAEQLKAYDVVLATYSTLHSTHRDANRGPLFQVTWKRMILDTEHQPTKLSPKLTAAILDVQADRRIIVIRSLVEPTVQDLGTHLSILQNLRHKNETTRHKAEDLLTGIMRQTTLKRTVDILCQDKRHKHHFASVTVVDVPIEFSDHGRAEYDNIVELVQDRIRQLVGTIGTEKIAQLVFEAIMLLRLYCLDSGLVNFQWLDDLRDELVGYERERSQPTVAGKTHGVVQNRLQESKLLKERGDLENAMYKAVIGEDVSGTSAPHEKMQALWQELEGISSDDNVVVLSQFAVFIAKVERDLEAFGIPTLRIHGSMSPEERRSVIESFNTTDPYDQAKWPKKNPRVLLSSLEAGACDLDLTAASHVIFTDPCQPAIVQQAMQCVRRIGQSRPVTVYHLWMEQTVEDQVRQKAKLATGVISLPVMEEAQKLARVEDLMAVLYL